MIGPFTVLAVMAEAFGGVFIGAGFPGWGIALVALGAGWHGILFATMQRVVQENKPTNFIECPECKGTRVQEIPFIHKRYIGQRELELCERCSGTGRVFNSD